MQHDKVTILCTRPLDPALLQKATERNVVIEPMSFIETSPVNDVQVTRQIQELAETDPTVVFTSMNAAEAVVERLKGRQPNWKIFCIGEATREIIGSYFAPGSILGTAGTASLLADEIIKYRPSQAVFFCGDQRRHELPEKLAANDITLNEVVVYNTVHTPRKISRDYDGILFFSPSAVESFFILNNLSTRTVLFAIGDTTAKYLRRQCSNRVITSVKPSKEQLVEMAIDYFTTSIHTNASVEK